MKYARIEFVPFKPEHVAAMGIAVPGWQAADLEQCRGWTMLVNGEPWGAAGINPMWPGVAEAWQFTRPGWRKYLKSAVREIRRRLPEMMAGLRRLQAACLDGPEYWGWLDYWGFTWEGKMPRYGLQGEDMIRAARVVD